AGVSRSTLAKRFAELVGEPPLTYLTRRRMTLAADLLRERDGVSVAAVAREVGYADPFAFSAAFKRVRGVNPSAVRKHRPPEKTAAQVLSDRQQGCIVEG
ncbi:helix-turn-helix transcriptional regulator, partial [Amycolatopsis sp. SID8362]|uniref:helix-turn-helix transcriptional regulator n=1 Tax=Amycolatopsis sp. SID8362 TaxID=2690346 RepID=UPI001369DE21